MTPFVFPAESGIPVGKRFLPPAGTLASAGVMARWGCHG